MKQWNEIPKEINYEVKYPRNFWNQLVRFDFLAKKKNNKIIIYDILIDSQQI